MHVTDSELDQLLTSPAVDDLSQTALVVSHCDGTQPSPAAFERLQTLPALVVGDGHEPARPPPHVDVVADPAVSPLEVIAGTATENPIASTTLALLLRGSERRSVADGLVSESAAYSVLQAGPEFRRWRTEHPARQRAEPPGPTVLVERDGDVLSLALNRPHVRNALNRRMRDELLEALRVAVHDQTVRAVKVRGVGPAFSAGGDLDEFGSFDDPASAHLLRLATSLGWVIHAIAGRVTFRLHGSCAGSGIELPAFAGRVEASPDATFALPELSLGLVPGAGGTVSLTRRIGRHRVALLALGGASIDASTARSWGMIDEITA